MYQITVFLPFNQIFTIEVTDQVKADFERWLLKEITPNFYILSTTLNSVFVVRNNIVAIGFMKIYQEG